MRASDYQQEASRTDRIPWSSNRGSDIAILGLVGELGSLASVLKKHQRDKDAYVNYKEDYIEEMGDILWYVTTIATRVNLKLDEWPNEKNSSSDIYEAFYQLQDAIFALTRIKQNLKEQVPSESLYYCIENVLACLQGVARKAGSNLSDVADSGTNKVLGYWGHFADIPARQFDKNFPEYERLPRQFVIDFLSINQGRSVIMQMNGVSIGDRLTDNSYGEDGYRFHDVFHIAGAAMLGWSPVFRRILKAKRKSDPKKDEVDDGARAAIVEEAVINHVFDYARGCRYFDGMQRVDLDLIKRVQKLVRGYEVSECEPWEWRVCILKGYEVFRQLKRQDNNGGRLIVDADKRSMIFEKLEQQ